MTGRVLAGRYVLGELLGRGGMGVVWRAHDTLIERDVAIKELLLPDYLEADEVERRSARMRREVRAAGRVGHVNVVTVFDVVVERDRPWIVMALLPGRPLAAVIADGPIAPARAARIGRQMLAGLAAVHRAGIEHRDVKPANVMVDDGDTVVLTDFGIATHPDSPAVTETGATAGTPEYMAPERAIGQPSGPPADLWSLGVTLYEMTEGVSPFRRHNQLATLQAVAEGGYEPPRYAGALTDVVVGLLAYDPAVRMTVAQAEPLLAAAGVGDEADTPIAPPPPVRPEVEPTEHPPTTDPPLLGAASGRPPAWRGRPFGWRDTKRGGVLAGALVAVLVAATGVTVSLPGGRGPDRRVSVSTDEPGPVDAREVYRLVEDPGGFTVLVPHEWYVRDASGERVFHRSPDNAYRLGVRPDASDAAGDPCGELRNQASKGLGPQSYIGKGTDYRELRLTCTTLRGDPAALWEFTWNSQGRVRRTINLRFVRSDGRTWDFWVSGPESGAGKLTSAFDAARGSFTPAG